MVFNRLKLFNCFKNIWQNLGKRIGHILSIYKSFNTWSCSKYWANPSKTLSGYFKLLKYLQRKYSPKIPGKFHHVTYDIFDNLAKSHDLENNIVFSYKNILAKKYFLKLVFQHPLNCGLHCNYLIWGVKNLSKSIFDSY